MSVEAYGKLRGSIDPFGAFSALPTVPGGPGGLMKCPTCGEHTPDDWESYGGDRACLQGPKEGSSITIDSMRCANNECAELIVRAHEHRRVFLGGAPMEVTESWTIRPRHAATGRTVSPLVPDRFRRDFLEAAAILDISSRMSAVLSRLILADLLQDYAGCEAYTIAGQIDKFLENPAHPSNLRENLHYLREIGDFSAHTKKNRESGEIIEVGHEEAEWTLEVVDRLFDYLIVGPAKDAQMRAAMDEKLRQAGRKPIKGREGSDDDIIKS